jgi:DNA-binding transcriptional MerR regulator
VTKRERHQAIGAVANRTGVAVKTLRFYSDSGLVPPSGRSRSGYRLYSEADIAKLELVLTLRDAGLSLDAIQRVLRRETTLAEALSLRLAAVEAHVASLGRVAAALRAALRSEPTEEDLRRLCAVTRLSEAERKAVIERFYQQVAEGIPVDQKWMRAMIDASSPKLPDEPTPAQLDAWIELAEIVADPKFVASLRANAQEVWQAGLDMGRLRSANADVVAAARDALARGVAIESADAKALVERYVAALAAVSGRDPSDPRVRAGIRLRFERQDPRASRYWELVAVLNGKHQMSDHVQEWRFIVAALLHHLPAGESAA